MSLKRQRCEVAFKWLRGTSFYLECLHQIIAEYATAFEGVQLKTFYLKTAMYCLVALPDGKLASGAKNGAVHIWNTDGETVSVLRGHLSYVSALVVLGPHSIASASGDHTVKVWHLGTCIQTLMGHNNVLRDLTVATGGQLVSASEDTTLRVWDTHTWQCQHVMTGHTKSVDILAPLLNGYVVSSAWDYTMRVWDLDSGTCVQVLRGHDNYVCSLAVLPNGNLASAAWDKTIKIWGADKCELAIPVKDFSGYLRLCTMPDGCLACVGVFDVTVYDPAGQLLFALNLGAFGGTATVVMADGSLLALTNSGAAVLWE
jgi:WD40 repeat protein